VKAPSGARFISFEGDVRVIRSATRETIIPGADTELYPGDTVQTQASRSRARRHGRWFNAGRAPNSTIIVRDNASEDDGKKTNVHVVVDSGQMYVRTEQQSKEASNVVETPKATTRMGAQTGGSFDVHPEGTEEIRINAGTAEATDRSGGKTILKGGEYVYVNPRGTISRPEKLLMFQCRPSRATWKVFRSRQRVSQHFFEVAATAIRLAGYYKVEVATSPFFVAGGKVIERTN